MILNIGDNDLGAFIKDNPKKGDYRFLDLPDNTSSATILFRNEFRNSTDHKIVVEISLCQIYSRWVEADIWYEIGESHSRIHLDTSLFDVQSHFGRSTTAVNLIKIGEKRIRTTGGQSQTEKSPYQDIIEYCIPRSDHRRCLAVTLTTYMITFLSGAGGEHIYN